MQEQQQPAKNAGDYQRIGEDILKQLLYAGLFSRAGGQGHHGQHVVQRDDHRQRQGHCRHTGLTEHGFHQRNAQNGKVGAEDPLHHHALLAGVADKAGNQQLRQQPDAQNPQEQIGRKAGPGGA